MRLRIATGWEQLRSGYWFIPSVMAIAAVFIAFLALAIDQALPSQELSRVLWAYGGGAGGARGVLSTIAGSMTTVTGVVFSITIVVLQLAATQFGPRLLRTFMRDISSQILLGAFIGIILYCLLILRTIRGLDDDTFIPQISVTLAVIFGVGGIAALIFFIHHTAMAIQPEQVIDNVGNDIDAAIDRLFPEDIGSGRTKSKVLDLLPEEYVQGQAIPSRTTGYIQAIDSQGLLNSARHRELVLLIEQRPGRYVIEGQTIATAYRNTDLTEEDKHALANCFIIGRQRTTSQDAAYAMEQLTQIALRGVSPAINDPYTAGLCIDRLSASLARLAARELPEMYRVDDDDTIRVVAQPHTFVDLLAIAYDPLRPYIRSNPTLSVHLADRLFAVLHACHRPEDRDAVIRQIHLIRTAAEEGIADLADRHLVSDHLQRLESGNSDTGSVQHDQLPVDQRLTAQKPSV